MASHYLRSYFSTTGNHFHQVSGKSFLMAVLYLRLIMCNLKMGGYTLFNWKMKLEKRKWIQSQLMSMSLHKDLELSHHLELRKLWKDIPLLSPQVLKVSLYQKLHWKKRGERKSRI